MAFLDRIKIRVEAGSGGRGAVSFRREKYVPRGGPDGGDGGGGGSVVLHTTTSVQDLSHLAGIPLFKAPDGVPGGANKRHGANGRELVISLPAGTTVRDVRTGMLLRDLDAVDIRLVIAGGGAGGRGNVHFASPINQVPRQVEPGKPGETRQIELELKLIADVGLVGLPNAGKSTLLSRISQAQPKIAPYPFTTLYPQLGVTEAGFYGRLVVADIPGLIEGAHRGVGLGDEFLRHIERTRFLVQVVDAAASDPVGDYRILTTELQRYGHGIPSKKCLIAANKMDIPAGLDGLQRLRSEVGGEILPISAATGRGIDDLVKRLSELASGPLL